MPAAVALPGEGNQVERGHTEFEWRHAILKKSGVADEPVAVPVEAIRLVMKPVVRPALQSLPLSVLWSVLTLEYEFFNSLLLCRHNSTYIHYLKTSTLAHPSNVLTLPALH